ncbi:MAG: ABC transporter ATP-binding protein [Oscillospiraceae bacterium]|nr:ABC transporter ATP-binding protein [Oscillospiraceae bacterium]
MIIASTDNLIKRFGKFEALKGINLALHEGEVFGFIGPNGAGKSTAIRVLLGILQASEGTAQIFGKDAWKDAVEIHKRVAYVPGDVSLWPNLTGGEIIDLFTRLRKKSGQTRRAQLIKQFDLDTSKKCRTYSKGNRQKVALVSAFASEADLYILDEPTSGLDPLMEQVFRQCVQEVKAQGKTVLLSSHILQEVEQLCDRVSIIRQGEIIETGTLQELRHLTRTSITVQTERPLEELGTQAGVHDILTEAEGTMFSVDTKLLGQTIEYLGQHGIVALECTPPTLEQLFMRHYE